MARLVKRYITTLEKKAHYTQELQRLEESLEEQEQENPFLKSISGQMKANLPSKVKKRLKKE